MKCPRCGKDNPADVHTCSPLALKLAAQADQLSLGEIAAELRRLHADNEALREALKQCRKMVGHPDNIALIDAALTGGKT